MRWMLLLLTHCTYDYECSDWRWQQCQRICEARGDMHSYEKRSHVCTCVPPKEIK